MGERVASAWLRDVIRVRRGGKLLLHDAVRFDGPVDALMQRPAVAAGARALATVVHVAAGAEKRLDAVRSALADDEAGRAEARVEAAASAWNGLLVVRFLAEDSPNLRRVVTAVLAALRDGRKLPRVWSC